MNDDIRPAERRDLDRCVHMLQALHAHGESLEPHFRLHRDLNGLRTWIREAWFGRFLPFPAAWLAVDDREPVGLISGGPVAVHAAFDQAPTARIDNLWVAPPGRGRGVGRRLVATFREAAHTAGYPRIEVSTLAQDSAARGFWNAVGFRDLRVTLVHR